MEGRVKKGTEIKGEGRKGKRGKKGEGSLSSVNS